MIPLSTHPAANPAPPAAASTPSAPLVPPALLLAARQAAALCGVSLATWWRWGAAGRCPAPIRISAGCVRWRRDELESWVACGCPRRKEWESRNANGRPRQAGR
jgi:prophage regulatory protein